MHNSGCGVVKNQESRIKNSMMDVNELDIQQPCPQRALRILWLISGIRSSTTSSLSLPLFHQQALHAQVVESARWSTHSGAGE
jgi:hypothetical protein